MLFKEPHFTEPNTGLGNAGGQCCPLRFIWRNEYHIQYYIDNQSG